MRLLSSDSNTYHAPRKQLDLYFSFYIITALVFRGQSVLGLAIALSELLSVDGANSGYRARLVSAVGRIIALGRLLASY